MEDSRLSQLIESYMKEICHFSQKQVFSTSYYQKHYFQIQIDEKVAALVASIIQYQKDEMRVTEL